MPELNLNNVVNVYLNLSPASVSGGDFGTLLIGSTDTPLAAFTGAHSYSSYEDVLADFANTTETAKAAALYFAQNPSPKLLKIACVSGDFDDFVTDINDKEEFYSLAFAGATMPTTAEAVAVADLIEAFSNPHIFGVTDTATENLDPDDATQTLIRTLSATGYRRTLSQYSANQNAVCSLLGRLSTVDFTQNMSTITLMFKQEPSVNAEGITKTAADELKKNHANVFVKYQKSASIIQYGVMTDGTFIDEVHGLDWLTDAVKTEVFNALYTSTTKIPQTDAGQNQLVSVVTNVMNSAKNNGLIGEGVWNGSPFGTLKTGDYLPEGFYIYSASFSTQSQADREQRKAMPIQCAVKLAGAIHTVDVSLTINR